MASFLGYHYILDSVTTTMERFFKREHKETKEDCCDSHWLSEMCGEWHLVSNLLQGPQTSELTKREG